MTVWMNMVFVLRNDFGEMDCFWDDLRYWWSGFVLKISFNGGEFLKVMKYDLRLGFWILVLFLWVYFLCGRYGFEVSSVSRRIFEVDLCWGDGLFKGLVEGWFWGGWRLWVGGKWVWEWCIFRISGDLGEFYNCQTICCM